MKDSIGPIEKVNLLLHRSIRYSYRQRTCRCCPTICCELLVSFLAISLLVLLRYVLNKSVPMIDLSRRIESSYLPNLILQPKTNETDDLVLLAKAKLNNWNVNVSNENVFDAKNNISNTILIRFQSNTSLRTDSYLSYEIVVQNYGLPERNYPIEFSFLSYMHPAMVPAAAAPYYNTKIFIDSLLFDYQSNRNIQAEFLMHQMKSTPYRKDPMFVYGILTMKLVLILIDLIFFIPCTGLLTNLIKEKNTKVKEMIKLLHIEPIVNYFAHGIRSLVILFILTIFLTVTLKFQFHDSFAYFHHVNFIILFLNYFVLSCQFITFAILNAQIFDRKLRATIYSYSFYFLSMIIWSYMTTWPVGVQYLFIFLSPYIAGRSIFQQMILHDLAGRNILFFEQIYRFVPIYFPTLFIMIFYCLFVWLLIWYLEKVLPSQYGIRLKWNFLFQRTYWFSKRVDEVDMENLLTDSDDNKRSIVRVKNLVKKFGIDTIAIDDVSFDLYENEITCLLGPNGSGKTTIFNCLIGIYQQTSGTIFIENQRNSIGYCPQHDILFDYLTIKEQIEFYAIARGYRNDRQRIVSEMLRLVDLEYAKDNLCRNLSGGMKRRLSLACAFIGENKIILLDEPSSGLDPSNRRLLWDWLRTMKQNKTLLLTTHFMEESDALSDRIIILSHGQIQVDATTMKLKEQYGSGYKLIVNKKSNHISTNELYRNLVEYLPQMIVETDLFNGDVVFRTNQQPNEEFLLALDQLESMKTKNQIENYGIENSTIDDVFFKITSMNQTHQTVEKQCDSIFKDQQLKTGFHLYLNQFIGLLIQTLIIRYRRWLLTLILILLPIISNFYQQNSNSNQTDQYQINIDSLNPQTILYKSDINKPEFIRALSSKAKFECRKENIDELIYQRRLNRPYTYTDIYLAFHLRKPLNNTYRIDILSSNLILNYETISLASNLVYKLIRNDSNASIQTTIKYEDLTKTGEYNVMQLLQTALNRLSCLFQIIPLTLFSHIILIYFAFFYISAFLINERKDKFIFLSKLSGLHPVCYWLFRYLFDVIVCLIWSFYLLTIYHLFNREKVDLPAELARKLYLLAILIILPTLSLVYLLTKFFRNDILGGFVIYTLLFISHIAGILLPLLISKSPHRKLFRWLINILLPNINAQVIISSILIKQTSLCQNRIKSITNETIVYNVLVLVFHMIFYWFLNVLLDSQGFRMKKKFIFNENQLDSDVLAERRRILNEQIDDSLIVKDLVKSYSTNRTLAIDHLTFGAKRGEIFGLLGFNGAGKTSTFRIIAGDLSASHGRVCLDKKSFGYCPQMNCEMNYLTVEDSLYFIARIRGLDFSKIKQFVQTISSLFLLEKFLKKSIHRLSGGTKRRLHAAIAFIGAPSVIILDEPTTGVDPRAKQQMQEIFLNAIKHQITIILTSHSMDECERVCNRLGIMVNGQLTCLGTIQHLKSKFSHGYTIQFKLQSNTIKEFSSFLQCQFSDSIQITETTQSTGLARIETTKPTDLFRLLEYNKQRFNIETYTISQTTLEQIFLSFQKTV